MSTQVIKYWGFLDGSSGDSVLELLRDRESITLLLAGDTDPEEDIRVDKFGPETGGARFRIGPEEGDGSRDEYYGDEELNDSEALNEVMREIEKRVGKGRVFIQYLDLDLAQE